MCENLPEQFLTFLNKLSENVNYQERITNKDSKFVNEVWSNFLSYYTLKSHSKLNDSSNYLVEGKLIDDLLQDHIITYEDLWYLVEVINNSLAVKLESVPKGDLVLPLQVKHDPNESQYDNEDYCNEEEENSYNKSNDLSNFSLSEDESVEEDKSVSDQFGDIDYFEDIPSDDEASRLKYKHFFKEEKERGEIFSNSEFQDENVDGLEDENGNEAENQSDEEKEEAVVNKSFTSLKSDFELKQERLKNRISKLEEDALKKKPWPLKGEVDATERPVNSLLEEVVEVDLSQRPAPVITKEVTLKLQDIIIKRIKDRVYDDVEKKQKPVQGPQEFKKAIVLDQEKSKLSLAELYEKEYLKQRSEQTDEKVEEKKLTPEQLEIKTLMISLFKKLDTLSNFHFIPKPAVPEIKVISNLPAIMVEEVTPEATTMGKLLAPEEIAGTSKRQLMSNDERSRTDKQRQLRKKKKFQSLRAKAGKISDSHNVSVKKNTSKNVNEGNIKSIKSSKSFFTKLQDEVESNISFKKRKLDKFSTTKKVKELKL